MPLRTSPAAALASMLLGVLGCGPPREPGPQPEAPAPPSAEQQARASCSAPLSSAPHEEQLHHGDEVTAKIERRAADVRRKLEQARKDRDVVLATCQSDKLSQLDRALRSAREHLASLKQAGPDASESSRHASSITTLCVRAEIVAAESDSCLGRPLRIGAAPARVAPLGRSPGWAIEA